MIQLVCAACLLLYVATVQNRWVVIGLAIASGWLLRGGLA